MWNGFGYLPRHSGSSICAIFFHLRGSGSLDFLDPWGNHVQVVDYREIQFTKAESVLRGMGLEGLEKTEGALQELRSKGLLAQD